MLNHSGDAVGGMRTDSLAGKSSVDTGPNGYWPSRLIDIARSASETRVDAEASGRMCVFCNDVCGVAADVISDAANESASVCVPHICDNRVPGWVVPGVRAVLVSHDGDDEVMIRILDDLLSRGCEVICISSEGEMIASCRDAGCDVHLIPSDVDETEAPWFVLGLLSAIVQASGLFDASDMLDAALSSAVASREDLEGQVGPTADALSDGVVAAYSTSDIRASARYWRQMMGSARSDIAFFGELPEFDHNELVGWSDPNVHAPELRILVIKGAVQSQLVTEILRCMLEVLEENGRHAIVADLGSGDSMTKNVRAMVLARMVAEASREVCRWPV